MSYNVHNFQNGEIIEAAPVNAMDYQIKKNSDEKLDASVVGTANGVASLDGTGKVPSSQLPLSVTDDNNGNVTMTF